MVTLRQEKTSGHSLPKQAHDCFAADNVQDTSAALNAKATVIFIYSVWQKVRAMERRMIKSNAEAPEVSVFDWGTNYGGRYHSSSSKQEMNGSQAHKQSLAL